MKFLAALLAAVVLLVTPAVVPAKAGFTPAEVTSLIRSTGCNAPVVTSDTHSIFTSFYVPSGYDPMFGMPTEEGIYIGTQIESGVTDEFMMSVILHESDHCIAFEHFRVSEYDYVRNPRKYELEADRYSVNKLCQMGYNGPKIVKDIWQYVHDRYGYNGDENHGTLEERMAQANNAPACAEQQQ